MLAFIGYAGSRMLCETVIRLSLVVCVPFLRFFSRTWSCLLLIAKHYRRTRVRTPSIECLPQELFPLCRA